MTPSTPPLQHDHLGGTSPLAQYLADAERSFDSISPSPPLPHGDGTIHGSKHSTRYGNGVTRRGRGGSRSGSHSPATLPSPERLDSLAITASQWAGMPPSVRTPSPGGASGPGAHPRHHSPNPNAPGSSPSRTRSPSLLDDGFAEKFRYLIASSGLLEKTQIATQTVPSAPESEADAAEEYLPPPASTGWWLPEALRSDDGIRYDLIAAITLILAGMIYMLGPTTVLVPSAAVAAGYTFLMPQGVRLPATTWELTPQPTPPISPPPKLDPAPTQDVPIISPVEGTGPAGRMMASLETLLSESKSLDKSIASSLQLLAPRPDDTEQAHELRVTIHRIMDDMTDSLAGATSALIPMADRSELTVLGNMYDIPVLGQRRQHDSTSEDDDNESPSVRAARRTRPRASSSFAALAPPLEHKRDGLLSAHERSYAESPIRAPAPQDPDDRFTKLPERNRPRHKRSSWSTDWNTPPPLYRSGHEVRGNNVADEDQGATESVFSATSTESSSMPASIPDNQAAHLMPAFSPTPPATRQQVQVFSPKRTSPLTQALERLEGTSLPRVTRATPPSSFSRPGQTFYRRSLQDIPYIASPPTTTQDHAASMAMARASSAMSSANRRSLQYNGGLVLDNAREELVTPSTLSRAASLNSSSKRASLMEPLVPRSKPSSKRASLGVDRRSNASSSQRTSLYEPRIQAPSSRRSSLLYGDHSGSERNTPPKRTSLLFTDALRSQLQVPDATSPLGFGLAPYRPTMQRVTSVSPLTLQGLKASYLGVHLKRRRVACCLLGLRFAEPLSAEAYWSAVIRAMRSLADAMGVARGKLEAIRSEVEREVAAAAALAAVTSLPLAANPRSAGLRPPSVPSSAGLGRDYAPRDSAEQALFTSVDELQHALARVWARCDEVRTRAAAGDTAGAVQTWTDIRADVGGMLRHVERGRDALARVGGQDPDERDGGAGENSMDGDDGRGEPADRDLPDFLRAWVERQPEQEREEIEQLVDEPPQPAEEPTLPPPGADEVYEATLPPAEPTRSTQTREERIALARQARAKGLTVAEMQALAAESPEVRRAREAEEDRRRAEGRVLVELEGVFGEIRRRKGMLPSENEQPSDREPHQVPRELQSEEVGIAL